MYVCMYVNIYYIYISSTSRIHIFCIYVNQSLYNILCVCVCVCIYNIVQGLVHEPYEMSTMSIFEQYSAGLTLLALHNSTGLTLRTLVE